MSKNLCRPIRNATIAGNAHVLSRVDDTQAARDDDGEREFELEVLVLRLVLKAGEKDQ